MKPLGLFGFTASIVLCLIMATSSHAVKVLYDDFSGERLHSGQWMDREFVREVAGGALISVAANSAANPYARNRSPFRNPAPITAITCDTTLNEAQLDDGPNPQSFARIDGRFYNTLNSGTERGDIWAAVFIGDRGSGIEAWWFVIEALDDQGNTWEEKGSGVLLVPGLDYGQTYTVRLAYSGDGQFSFEVGGVQDAFSGPQPQGPEFTHYKALETLAFSDGGSGIGYTSATFDNVIINDETQPYDDFSTPPLDHAKWTNTEVAAEISAGSLRLNREGYDAQSQRTLALVYQDTPYLEAKVRIEGSSDLPLGMRGIARLQGYFYNDSYGPGSGLPHNLYEGNVFAQVRLSREGNGDLKAQAMITRVDDPNEMSDTVVLFQDFTIPILFDTDYTLSIEFIPGEAFVFACNAERIPYFIQTPTYPAYSAQRKLRARLYLDPGEYGYVKTRFDDVRVGYPDGDINFDKQVTMSDLLLALQVAAGFVPTAPVYKEADVTGNGQVGIAEAILILQTLSGVRTVTLPFFSPIGVWNGSLVGGEGSGTIIDLNFGGDLIATGDIQYYPTAGGRIDIQIDTGYTQQVNMMGFVTTGTATYTNPPNPSQSSDFTLEVHGNLTSDTAADGIFNIEFAAWPNDNGTWTGNKTAP